MIKKILVPLDGSSFGEAALKYIENLGVRLKPGKIPEVTLLQVIRISRRPAPVEGGAYDFTTTPKALEAEKQRAMEYLEKAAQILRLQGATVNCLAVIGEEGASSAMNIIKTEADIGADLVVMSTHGRRGITRWAFGSVAEKVLRSGSVPVLMVRVKK